MPTPPKPIPDSLISRSICLVKITSLVVASISRMFMPSDELEELMLRPPASAPRLPPPKALARPPRLVDLALVPGSYEVMTASTRYSAPRIWPIPAAEGVATRPLAPKSCSCMTLPMAWRSTSRKRPLWLRASVIMASMPFTGTVWKAHSTLVEPYWSLAV